MVLVACVAAQLPGDLEPVEPGHHPVEDGNRGQEVEREPQRLVAAPRQDDLVPCSLEAEREQLEDVLVVVCDEHEQARLGPGLDHAASSTFSVSTVNGRSIRNVVPRPSLLSILI